MNTVTFITNVQCCNYNTGDNKDCFILGKLVCGLVNCRSIDSMHGVWHI